MKLDELQTKYKEDIMSIAKKRNIDNVRVFGSVAKGTANADSDVDFLIHLRSGADLIDLSGFCLDMEDLLQQKVDVVPDNSIHWSMKDQVLKEAIPL